jgi:hypothetical protein
MNKCPMCEKELATYQVSRLGEEGGPQEREVGCAKENAPCLLAGHSWPLSKWDELCQMVAAAGEGYPGAAHDRMTINSALCDLVHRWKERACLFSEVHPSPAGSAFMMCARELCEATDRGNVKECGWIGNH